MDVTYNKEAYIIEGLPETADVTLIGRTVDLYLAKQSRRACHERRKNTPCLLLFFLQTYF